VVNAVIKVLTVALSGAAALLVVQLEHWIMTKIGRRIAVVADLSRRTYRAFQALLFIIAIDLALRGSDLHGGWFHPVTHVIDVAAIGAGGWLLGALLFVAEDLALLRFRTDVQDNRAARTVRTQVQLLRRVTVAAIVIIAFAAALLTFREARIVGTSLLASAGLVAAIGAFAAQQLLGNVFAGLQIAFGESLRLDDVVVVNAQWGRIEEITLTYVVVHLWDDRRMIMPTSYFTSTPFENWTHSQSSLLGSVEMDVDWMAPVEEMREELREIVHDTPMWDKRVSVLQVTDAVGGMVHLRALVSARDAPTLWDLRCLVRERMVSWLRDNHPHGLPRVRAEVGAEVRAPSVEIPTQPNGYQPGSDARVFGGDRAGRSRAREFTGPDEA
jgi:small-conductance mechanosensitive channel